MAVKSLQVLYLGASHADLRRLVPIYRMAPKPVWQDTVFLSLLIRTDDSKNILVDTGWHPDDVKEILASGSKLNIRPEDHLPNRLKEVGLSMDDIDMVVMTHLHHDHYGCLNSLRHAEIVLQKEEYQFALEPPPYAYYKHPERFNSPEIRWRLVEGDQLLMPGLTVLFTPGHTPGHQSVMVDLPEFGSIILAGDAGPHQENFDKEIVPSNYDSKQAFYSIRKLKAWSQVREALIFTYDLDFWSREIRKPPEAYT